MADFRPLGEELLHHGHVIDLYRARFAAPDGTEISRDIVRHPGAVSVVPLLDSGEVVLLRQFRAPLGREILEIPAGKLDVEGEDLEAAASRELVEEVGLEAEKLDRLLSIHNSVGFCDEICHVYLATGLREVDHDRQGPEEMYMQEVRIPLGATPKMIESGEITDAKTVIGLMATLQRTPAG